MVLKRHLSIEVVIYDVEHCSYPETVTGINEFVCSAVEPSKLHLSLG
jgi:hypothetical protein